MTMYAWMIEKQDELIKKWNTRNPFEIAEFLEIAIFFEDLGNMYGYYNMKNRIKMIHINENITIDEQLFTCAHELQHAIFHEKANTPFLSEHTLQSVQKIETQANFLATRLLIANRKIDGINTKIELLRYYGIPLEMARFL